jgi:hypothetical protein
MTSLSLSTVCCALADATCDSPHEVLTGDGQGSSTLSDVDTCASSNSYCLAENKYDYTYTSDYVLHITSQPEDRHVTFSVEPYSTAEFVPMLVVTTYCGEYLYDYDEVFGDVAPIGTIASQAAKYCGYTAAEIQACNQEQRWWPSTNPCFGTRSLMCWFKAMCDPFQFVFWNARPSWASMPLW